MKSLSYFCLSLCFYLSFLPSIAQNKEQKPVLLIHGGAGNIENLPKETEDLYKAKLTEALNEGYSILEKGGSSLDAVTAAVVVMEDSPFFNAGRGAVLTSNNTVELDASVMNGENLQAGAVTLISNVKNPVLAAKAVMEKSPFVMLGGEGAEAFAKDVRLDLADSFYFLPEPEVESKDGSGTVGAVAVDCNGNLAAATSTGGISGKAPGRIGDSPVIGAGTYADNRSCAVSCTGKGEYFIRLAVAKEISALVELKGYSVEKAAKVVINKKLDKLDGVGGVIVLDRKGNYAFIFNTKGMFRGVKTEKFTNVLMY